MDFTRKLSFLVFLLCLLFSLRNQAETNKEFSFQAATNDAKQSLKYDYYSDSCPLAEQIIRSAVRELYNSRPDIAPALLRLVFHDCFVKGCDASVLLDKIKGEKGAPPNLSLRGFDAIDTIKSKVEEACPGIVSCADIIVLSARESVLMAGGPFYPLNTGRRDTTDSFLDAASDLPSPQDDLSVTIGKFGKIGFDERETVTLLGAHSTGIIHCNFISNRLYNFTGTGAPDPTLDTGFLEILRSKCNSSNPTSAPSASASLPPSPSSSASSENPGMKMDYEGPRTNFGTLYYRSLLQGKGILFVDQQMTASEETVTWVQAYASDVSLFQRDFGLTMMKLSNYNVSIAPAGQVRLNCRKVN